MQIFKINNYIVACESAGTRHGFKHTAKISGGCCASMHYLNRTCWECYTYQSVLLTLFYNMKKARLEYAFERYKEQHNKKRLSQNIKDAIEEIECADINECIEKVKNGNVERL